MNKRRNKKYVPREVRYPQIINLMGAFEPFEKVLEGLLTEGTILEGDDNRWYIRDTGGKALPLEDEVQSYIMFIEIVNRNSPTPIDASCFEEFRKIVRDKEVFTESLVLRMQESLNICKPIFSRLTSLFIHNAFKEMHAKRPYVIQTSL